MTGRVAMAAALWCTLLAAAGAAETNDYSIARYELTVETTAGSDDVRVTLDITYDIRSGTKFGGFKYIGSYQAVGLSGRDGSGVPIPVSLVPQRETRIDWTFPPVTGPARKSVIVTFTIPNALTGSRRSNTFVADWAGIFRVPVRYAVYRLIFPDGTDRTVSGVPRDLRSTMRGGRRSVEVEQEPLAEQSFRVTFAPGIAEGSALPAMTPSGTPMKLFLVIALFIVLLAVLSSSSRRSRRDGSSWSTSSCAGSSSCGGGGGCGGGGCGGGCGG